MIEQVARVFEESSLVYTSVLLSIFDIFLVHPRVKNVLQQGETARLWGMLIFLWDLYILVLGVASQLNYDIVVVVVS